jgi:cation diffusion facilitator family transporter
MSGRTDREVHEHADHDHDHAHEHRHESGPRGAVLGALTSLFRTHSHDPADSVDDALAGSARGIWAVKISLVGLGATALLQLIVVAASGSVALLADSIHNVSDALTAVPLWIAFVFGRRAPTRRYTYGYGRAEDLAGVFIVVMIALSAVLAGFESIRRLLEPQAVQHLGWVAVAGVVGFLGNEAVAIFRINVGRQIGSAALVADGLHARTDGLTSLAVVLGAIGVALGFPIADPLVGLLITAAILLVLRDAALQIWHRMMDAIDPELLDRAEHAAREADGVQDVTSVRARWIGHALHLEAHIVADCDLRLTEAHEVAERARHAMVHAVPKLASATVHVDPCEHEGRDHHADLSHHRPGFA